TEVPARMNQRQEGRSSITLASGLLYVLKVSVALFLDLFRDPWAGFFDRDGGSTGLERHEGTGSVEPASAPEPAP
ncbi:MAG TPA: hypothetical protein VK837_14050, partial [Longimicrobiales bacterium]|nr:hypothetical protein [Longimicrobiales bacterium]